MSQRLRKSALALLALVLLYLAPWTYLHAQGASPAFSWTFVSNAWYLVFNYPIEFVNVKRANGYRFANMFPAPNPVSAAIADLGPQSGNGGTVILPCGNYSDNIVESSANGGLRIRLLGQGRDCTFLFPADLTKPAISFQTTSNSSGGLINNEVHDLTIRCPGSCSSDGVQWTGTDANDWTDFENVRIDSAAGYGFVNCLNINGRSIWDTFRNVELGNCSNDGIKSATAGAVNHILFENVRTHDNFNYGVEWNNSNATPSQAIDFFHFNAENNGQNTSLVSCADMYLAGIGSGQLLNGYLENGCLSNGQANPAELRITGTYGQSFSVLDTTFNANAAGVWHIYNDATQSTGVYQGNHCLSGKGVGIATNHPTSYIKSLYNFGCTLFSDNQLSVPAGYSVNAGSSPEAWAVTFNSSGSSNFLLTLPSSPNGNGWACDCQDITTGGNFCKVTSPLSASTVTIANFTSAGALVNWTTGDVIRGKCQPL